MSDDLILAHNLEMEEACLGALMISESAIDAVLGGTSLKPAHFYRGSYGRIFASITTLAGRGDPVDALTVSRELEKAGALDDVGGRSVVSNLASATPVPGNAGSYAGHIIEDANWRNLNRAGHSIIQAAVNRDEAALATAEALLGTREDEADFEYHAERQGEIIRQMAAEGEGAIFPWPFERLTARAPLGAGTFNVLSGYTSTGKSTFADDCLDLWHKRGIRCALYMNEGTLKKRLGRRVARNTNVDRENFRRGELIDNEPELIDREAARDSWPIFTIHGKTATQVAHHIRRRDWDVVVIDLLNRFPIDNPLGAEREIAGMINVFADAAALANTAIVLIAQPNRQSAGAIANRRKPNVFDLKGSGDIETHSDLVMFVYRERDEDDEMVLEGEIYTDKARDGGLASVPVLFDEKRQSYLPRSLSQNTMPAEFAGR